MEKKRKRKEKKRKRKGRKGRERGREKKKGVRKIKAYDQFILLVSNSYAHLQIGIPIQIIKL